MLSDKKILLIEDEDFLIFPLRIAFERESLKMYVAKDGIEGFARAKKDLPDLIILDLILPKRSGFDVLDDLKRDPLTKKIPVIILSNLAREDDIKRGLAGGAVEYMVKTDFSITSLMSRMHELLKG